MADERIDYLDGWRGLSIFFVLQGHFLSIPWIDLGGFGVVMFFCLSGRLMAHLLFERRQPLGQFYRRRISRVFPAFAVFVVAMFLLAAFRGRSFSGMEFASTILFLRTYFPAPGIWGTGMPIGHLWSLNVEEHAYLLMSLLVLLRVFREGWVMLGAAALCVVIGFAYIKFGGPFWGQLGTEVAASFIFASAGYRLVCSRVRRLLPSWVPVACLVLAAAISQASPVWWLSQAVNPFLMAVAVNHLSEAPGWLRAGLSVAMLRQVGLWSFSLYLWQQPFYAARHAGTAWPLALAGATCAGLASFYLIERPFRTWLNTHWQSSTNRKIAETNSLEGERPQV